MAKYQQLLVYQEPQHIQTNEEKAVPLTSLIDYFNDQISQSEFRILPDQPLVLRDGRVVGRFATVLLTSAFQIVVRARDPECVIGHEALLRAYMGNGQPIAPRALLRAPRSPQAVVYLDRLCRMVHMLNYLAQRESRSSPLFVNVRTEHLLRVPDNHGWYFEQVLQRCGLTPQHVVIDVHASAIQDAHAGQVHTALANYRERGYRVSIEDLDLAEGVFDLLWRVRADIVKLDVRSLLRADKSQRGRLHRLAEHTPIEIIATGVETSEQARTARAFNVDGLQGFYFGAPEADPLEHPREMAHGVLEARAWARVPSLACPDARLQFCC